MVGFCMVFFFFFFWLFVFYLLGHGKEKYAYKMSSILSFLKMDFWILILKLLKGLIKLFLFVKDFYPP